MNIFFRIFSAGGLVTAVAPVCIECKGIWVGWPGIQLEENETIPESSLDDRSPTAGLLSGQVECVTIEPTLFDQYYNGCKLHTNKLRLKSVKYFYAFF